MRAEQFIERRSAHDPGPAWIWSPSVSPCEGFAAPGAEPRFARSHRDLRPGVYFLRVPWCLRVGRRVEIVWTRVCASCGFVLLGIAAAYRGGGSAARDSTLPSPSPTKPRGLIGERMLWAALFADAVAVLGGAPATRYERTQTCAWIADVKTEAPGSFSFVCGVLGFDVDATRAALRRSITGPSGGGSDAGALPRAFRACLMLVNSVSFRFVPGHAPRRTYEN